jgi:hypothetical protein
VISGAEKMIIERKTSPPRVPEDQISACLDEISKILLRFGQQPDLSSPASMLCKLRIILGMPNDAAMTWRKTIRRYWSDHRPLAARVLFSTGDIISQSDKLSAPCSPLTPCSPVTSCSPPPVHHGDALRRLKCAAQATPADPSLYPDGLTVARMMGFAAGVHCAISGGLMKQECRGILDRLGVAGAAGMKVSRCQEQMRKTLLECGFDRFEELETQISQLTIATQTKFAQELEAPHVEGAQACALSLCRTLHTSPSSAFTLAQAASDEKTPTKPSDGSRAFTTPQTSQKSSQLVATKNLGKDLEHIRVQLADVKKFYDLLAQIKDCDIHRMRKAAAGQSRSIGGLNIPEFTPLLARFNVDVRDIKSRSEANTKLTQLLEHLGLLE